MAEAKPKAEPKVPSFLWFQCGGRGPVPTITQFERMQKGDRSTYEKANAATDRVKAAKRRKSSSGWRSDLTLLNPLSARRLQMDYDRLKIVKGVEKGMTEEEKAEEEVKEEEKKEEVAEEEEKKEKPKYKEPEAQAPAGGEEQKEMEQKIRKMRRQMKTLRAALNKALDSKYESDEETSGDEGKTSGDESGGEAGEEGAVVSVPPGGTNPTWRHVNPPKGKKKGKKSVKINPEVEMEIIEAEDDAEGEAVSVLPVKLLESGKDR